MRRIFPAPSRVVDLDDAYRPPPGRHLRANMVASVDGAASLDGRSGGLSGPADKRVFTALRRAADVVLVGAGTVRAEGYRPADRPIAVVSDSLALPFDAPLFAAEGARPVVLTGQAAAADRLAAARRRTDLVVTPTQHVDLAAALDVLAGRGLPHVLCEGGPRLLAALLRYRLLDELCMTFAPLLAGGDAGRIVRGAPEAGRPLSLSELLTEDGYLFARYRLEPEPEPVPEPEPSTSARS